MFALICAWINGWANNRKAGDLRRHYTHYDVTDTYIRQLVGLLTMAQSQNSPGASQATLRNEQATLILHNLIS